MGWAAIITLIIELVGPYLMEWLKQLLERWLSRAAADLPAPATGADVVGLFDAAIDRLPRLAFARRALLRAVKRVAEPRAESMAHGVSVSPLSPAEVADLADIAWVADAEIGGA